DDLIKSAPLEKIMVETDCPYVAPTPYRGKRNEPAYVIEAAKTVARICGKDTEEVRKQLLENARNYANLVMSR
ncbi:MAG: TatD family hydrolase, partial [Patescibacteria group bacterium]|nr:TatD family hydrolase [Patescibacteria group bacterium]